MVVTSLGVSRYRFIQNQSYERVNLLNILKETHNEISRCIPVIILKIKILLQQIHSYETT